MSFAALFYNACLNFRAHLSDFRGWNELLLLFWSNLKCYLLVSSIDIIYYVTQQSMKSKTLTVNYSFRTIVKISIKFLSNIFRMVIVRLDRSDVNRTSDTQTGDSLRNDRATRQEADVSWGKRYISPGQGRGPVSLTATISWMNPSRVYGFPLLASPCSFNFFLLTLVSTNKASIWFQTGRR